MKKLIALVLIAGTPGVPLQAQETEMAACADDPVYAMLDFWVGEWVVYSGDTKAGENRIEKILDGCAIAEFWVGNGGGKGQSLFYVDTDGQWQQVWVTAWAANPGGVKEKTRVASQGDSVRFQGEISHPVHGRYLDRTTLTPGKDGTVRQLIEVSTDGGETWRATFDAVYKREPGNDPA